MEDALELRVTKDHPYADLGVLDDVDLGDSTVSTWDRLNIKD